MTIQVNYAKQINELHNKLGLQLRTPIKTAIEIGKLLCDVKKKIGYGNYKAWIYDNCNFSERTAYNYVATFNYNDKIASVATLQEAYKQIEQIEYQKKLTESQKKKEAIKEYKQTGAKSNDWNRSYDYEYNKQKKEDEERTERINKAKENMNKKEKYSYDKEKSDDLHDRVNKYLEDETEKQKYREKLTTSFTEQESFFDVIDAYIKSLDSDNNKLEALHNIIKYSKTLVNKLQIKSVGE